MHFGFIAALFVFVVAVDLLVLRRFLPLLALRGTLQKVGTNAIQRQPDAIHLQAADISAWPEAQGALDLAAPLLGEGFQEAGIFTVPELPGVVLQLLAQPIESMYAAIYEHPKAGRWLELTTRYPDGSYASFSTLRPTGLKPRPGCMSFREPGAAPAGLYKKALSHRPKSTPQPASVSGAVSDFEAGYASDIAWRKAQGVTSEEVAEVYRRRVA